ncbi:Domain of uncharacterised function (DUF2825) [Fannyhessea vaginae]|nr:Domain of uncharacterised function (DUF2825) [Fannyhessea vaginae]SSZ04924.1 Domain of uncharacterised function (DUF2825) [Fannyhessea vaginae]
MREKPSGLAIVAGSFGITPAYAGKTLQRQPRKRLVRDHPRVCGKNYHLSGVYAHILGSPPRMREKLFAYSIKRFFIRITPAYAGKTMRWTLCTGKARDHPRVCGKNSKKCSQNCIISGSPPRMREKLITIIFF